MVEKSVKVTNKGMISIPAEIRKKYDIKDGDYIVVKEEENGSIKLIPLEDISSLRNRARTIEDSREIFKQSRREDRDHFFARIRHIRYTQTIILGLSKE